MVIRLVCRAMSQVGMFLRLIGIVLRLARRALRLVGRVLRLIKITLRLIGRFMRLAVEPRDYLGWPWDELGGSEPDWKGPKTGC